MVGRGGRSKGCLSCRKRHIKCDEQKPRCLRCKNAGFSCEYTAFGIIHGRRASPPEISALATTEAPTETAYLLHQPLTLLTDDTFLTHLRSSLLAVPITQENVIRAGFGTWPAFFADPIQHRLASQCLLSLSRVYFARHHGSPELINQGTALYVKSLKTLHSALGDVKVRTADDTLFAVMILGLYEMLELSSTDGWIAHALGLGKVIETRGAKSFDGPEQRILFECNRFIIILASLAGNKATFLSLNEWKTEPWASAPESKSLLHYLLDLFADLATLKAETLKSSTTTQLGVRSQISRVMADLLEWRAAWDIINSREVLEVPNPTIDDQAALPTVLQFNSIHIANDMCLYDACFVQAFRVLKWAGGANDAAYFALNERAALEICQTIDYLQHSAPWMTAQFLVLFPLRMAFLAVEHSPSPLRTWVERKLTMFTTSQQGWGVAKKLHYYGSK